MNYYNIKLLKFYFHIAYTYWTKTIIISFLLRNDHIVFISLIIELEVLNDIFIGLAISNINRTSLLIYIYMFCCNISDDRRS